ncbi:MAG: DUF6912 family protein [Cellulomonadaceae bacterium]
MRIYLPITLDRLTAVTLRPDGLGQLDLPRGVAHAVTAALEAAMPDEDSEGLEYAALLAAADDDLALIASDDTAPRLRGVLTVEVPDAAVVAQAGDAAVLTPSAVDVAPVPAAVVVCAHVDEPVAGADVAATLAGDDAAAERLVERDLLWYDVTELADIPGA